MTPTPDDAPTLPVPPDGQGPEERKPRDRRLPPGAATLRMAQSLASRAEVEGGFAPLARAIRGTYEAEFGADDPARGKDGKPRDVVDRRKLRAIVEGEEEIVFSTRELRALDLYLEPYGEGLSSQPLFEKPNLIQTLARSRTVSFLLGSRTSEEGEIHFPHWDVLAMAEIQKRITQMELPVRINIQDVPMGQDEVPVDLESHFEQPGQSLVCLGSHRLMSTSSLMLERMFGLDATPERRPRLPFAIVWNEALHRLESPFRRSAVEIEVSHPDAAAAVRQQNGGSVLVAGEDAWIDTLTARGRGHGYGVCVAQRRASGAVWMLLAGVSGPATYATARLAHRLDFRLGEPQRGAASPVWWAAVSATVPPGNEDKVPDLRDFEPQVVVPPTPWRPED